MGGGGDFAVTAEKVGSFFSFLYMWFQMKKHNVLVRSPIFQLQWGRREKTGKCGLGENRENLLLAAEFFTVCANFSQVGGCE